MDNSIIRHPYDPQDHLRNITRFRGTSLEYVLFSKNFWALQVKHTLIFLGWAYCSDEIRQDITDHWVLRSGYLAALSSLVVFTIVFYAGNCYTAYKELFRLSVDCRKELVCYVVHLKGLFANREDVWHSIRHLLAAHRLFYYDLQNMDNDHAADFKQWAHEHLITTELLTQPEVDRMSYVTSTRISVLTAWAEASFLKICKQNPHFKALPPPCQSAYMGKMMMASEKLQHFLLTTVNVKNFGVPFIYHHIVHLLVNLYLVLLSVSSIFLDTTVDVNYWTMITYPIVCFVTMGILSSADAMADPFGLDDCDFDMLKVQEGTLQDAITLCDMIKDDEALLANELKAFDPPPPPANPTPAPESNGKAISTGPAPAVLPLASDKAFLPARRELLAQNGGAGPDASRRMMGLVSAAVRMLAESSTEQQAVLQECDRRMLAVLGETKSRHNYDGEHRRHERRRHTPREGGRPPSGKPAPAQVDRAKRRDKEGVEMSSRRTSTRASSHGENGAFDVDSSVVGGHGDQDDYSSYSDSDGDIIPMTIELPRE